MDLIDLARQQADEIARAGHNGWGNTMTELAAALEAARGESNRWRDRYRAAIDQARGKGANDES